MFFIVYITKCANIVGILEKNKYKNLEELKSKLKATGGSYGKIKNFLYPETLNLNNKAFTEEVTLKKEVRFTIEDALGDFLNCENILDVPLSHCFENIGMSELEIEFIDGWFQGAKNRALEYLEDYYPKDSSLATLKTYEDSASICYSWRCVQITKCKDGVMRINDAPADVTKDIYSVKYFSQLKNNLYMIPFAIIHYLISYGYKIKKCKHCHKYFAMNHLVARRKIYCDRNSPYKGCEHLNCEQAVRNTLTKLSSKRRSLYTRLDNMGEIDRRQDFVNECKKYRSKIKKESSVKNLQEYEQFLKNYKIKGT